MIKHTNPIVKYAAAFVLVGASATAFSDEAALIDILQRKGVLSQKEADSVRKELATGGPANSASKIKLNDSVSELNISGDLRMRYQYDSKDAQLSPAQGGGSNVTQRSRARFRLRLNAEYALGEHWFAGVGLSTNQDSSSGNQTFDGGFSKYGIYISKAYLGWKNDWAKVVVGKASNPFYTTDLVWDPDINPSGVFESIAFHKLGGDDGGGAGYAKDGKTAAPHSSSASPWELTLNAGQMFYNDNAESNRDGDTKTDAYVFETQLVASYNFGGVKATIAPAWFYENAASLSGVVRGNNSFQDNALVSGATRNLNLLLAPGDLSFKLGDLPTKIMWDFSYNLEGSKRAQDILRLRGNPGGEHKSQDNLAYLVGFQVGQNKKEGDWSLLANWRQTGIAAVDPNLHDDDFALGELNTRGVKTSVAYNFTPYAIATVTYMFGWNLRDSLVGGEVTGGNAIGDANAFQYLTVDFSLKF